MSAQTIHWMWTLLRRFVFLSGSPLPLVLLAPCADATKRVGVGRRLVRQQRDLFQGLQGSSVDGHDAPGAVQSALPSSGEFAFMGSQSGSITVELSKWYPFYHTSQEIAATVSALSKGCGGAFSVHTESDSDVNIDVVTVRNPGARKLHRFFFLFGEHSRELISPESGLEMLGKLCGDSASSSLLRTAEFQVVLNANPRSRTKVEKGEYCLRTNPSGVDLNRNWDEKWQNGGSNADGTSGGPAPWSEPETRILKKLVSAYRPTAFVTVHSGTRGMYMPWAYDTDNLATRNQPAMMNILRALDQTYCKCPFGAAGREVGYACPGTCMDWVYDHLQTPYSFAFEIFVGRQFGDDLEERWKAKLKNQSNQLLLDGGAHLGHAHFSDVFSGHASDFATGEVDYGAEASDQAECFRRFNPETKEEYDATVENWASAYLEMARMVVALEDERQTGAYQRQAVVRQPYDNRSLNHSRVLPVEFLK